MIAEAPKGPKTNPSPEAGGQDSKKRGHKRVPLAKKTRRRGKDGRSSDEPRFKTAGPIAICPQESRTSGDPNQEWEIAAKTGSRREKKPPPDQSPRAEARNTKLVERATRSGGDSSSASTAPQTGEEMGGREIITTEMP